MRANPDEEFIYISTIGIVLIVAIIAVVLYIIAT